MSIELPEPDKYRSTLLESFQWRYSNKRDSWSPGKSGDRGLDGGYSMMLKSAPAHSGFRILDIGAGTGERLAQYAPAGCVVVGLDLISQPLWPALSKAYEGTLTFEEGDFFTWTPPDFEFDVIIDSGILHHQHPSTYERYLEKVRAILAPRGTFGILVYKEQSEQPEGSMQTTDHGRLCRNFTEDELSHLLSSSGFDPFETGTFHRNDGVPYLVMCSRLARP